jgi:hypothetical protein
MAKKIVLSLILACAVLLTACGSKTSTVGTTSPSTSTKQLDPQGNWEFTVTSADGTQTLNWGEQLYELSPPVVTANTGLGWANAYPTEFPPVQNFYDFTMAAPGVVSGTDTMTFNVTASYGNTTLLLPLTGTIAPSQASVTGTWTSAAAIPGWGFAGDAAFPWTGTFTAQLLAPVTGTYSGTLTGTPGTISVAMSLSEVTSQTATNMGTVTGTITVSGSPCFNSSTPLTFSSANNVNNLHLGEYLTLQTQPDANGQVINLTTTPVGVDPNTAAITVPSVSSGSGGNFTFNGGPCNGQTFAGTLTQ